MKLPEQAKKLPLGPGVYFFLDAKRNVLYVGRATSLRRRVLSYFRTIDPKAQQLVQRATKIKAQKTETVLESVFLEANLIKKYWPKYNIKERDNRSFLYLIIPKTDYSRPFLVRERELEKFSPEARIFGPYQSLRLIETALKLARQIFPYSTCQPFSGRPCFDYQVGLCPGLCLGIISKKDYQKNIANLILLLKGEKKRLIKKLKKENPDKILALKHLQDVALISQDEAQKPFFRFAKIEGYDVSHLSGKETVGSMVVFINAESDKRYYRLFKIKQDENNDLAALEEVITRRFGHQEWSWPDLILVDGGKPQVSYLSKVLEKNSINIPLVGISKFANDKLVFPNKSKDSFKKLAQLTKPILLMVREEAHRFALRYSRQRRRNRFKTIHPGTRKPRPSKRG